MPQETDRSDGNVETVKFSFDALNADQYIRIYIFWVKSVHQVMKVVLESRANVMGKQ